MARPFSAYKLLRSSKTILECDVNCYCVVCSADVNPVRYHNIAKTCMKCGEKLARTVKHTIVPMHKSNLVPIYNLADLVGINTKGGLVNNQL